MKKIKEIYENRISKWKKYSSYEIVKIKNCDYIVPSKNSVAEWYDPIENEEELISDVLNIGKIIADTEKYEKIKKTVFDFVSKYGLLGWIMYLPVNENFYLESTVFLTENEYFIFSNTTMDTKKYIEQFQIEPSKENIFETTKTLGRSPVYELIFSKNYCEPVDWAICFLQEMYEHFRAKEMIYDSKYNPLEKFMLMKKIENFHHVGVPYVIKYYPTLGTYWIFNSLTMIIETACLIALGQKESPIAICKHCGKYFYREDIRIEYCSHKCRNRYHVYKSRNKNKKQLEK